MISRSRVTVASAALLAIGFAALMVIVGMTFRLAERAQADLATSLSARNLATVAAQLRYGLNSAESSQRGYVASGNEIYLAPYGTAKAEVSNQVARLVELYGESSLKDAAVQRLLILVDEKLQEMDTTIALKRDRRDAEALAVLRSNRGKALMDEANVFISSIIRHADSSLDANAERQKAGLFDLRRVIAASAILILLVVAVTLAVITGFARSLGRARDEVAELNADLERRVQERTSELSTARDRAQLLLAEVNHRVSNSLALVASMVGLQARAAATDETRTALSETQARISAVALVHKQLYGSGDVRSVDLSGFLSSLLEQLDVSMRDAGHQATLKAEIAPISLPTDKSVSLGVIAAEWVTNAFKYAYPQGAGEIRVTLKREVDGSAVLRVDDDGVGRREQKSPKGTGLGTRLVNAMAMSLGGQVEYLERSPGTSARLILPAA
jgi:two-component sensor histidine kinase